MFLSNKKKKRNEEISKSIHLFSHQAFEVAQSFVAGDNSAALKQKATELKNKLPAIAAQMQEADPAYRPDLNQTLSEARLDLDYVLEGGGRPSSIRLMQFIQDRNA